MLTTVDEEPFTSCTPASGHRQYIDVMGILGDITQDISTVKILTSTHFNCVAVPTDPEGMETTALNNSLLIVFYLMITSWRIPFDIESKFHIKLKYMIRGWEK